MTWEDEFIADYKNMSEEELYKKYYKNIPADVSNAGIVARIMAANASCFFIDEVWYGDRRDSRINFLLLSPSGQYEVFQSERGGKHLRTVHTSLEEALETKIDLLLYTLGHKPPDAKFYSY